MTSDLIASFESFVDLLKLQVNQYEKISNQYVFIANEITSIQNHFEKIVKKEENKSFFEETKKKKSKKQNIRNRYEIDAISIQNQDFKSNSKKKEFKRKSQNSLIIKPKFETNANEIILKKNLYHQNCISFKIGFMGEAYLYEQLKEMKIFEKVIWNAKTNDVNKPCVILNNGHKYNVKGDDEHFDINAEDSSGNMYYFEVKSTNKDDHSAGLSRAQKNFGLKLNENGNFIIAVVANVLTDPKIEYVLFYKSHRYHLKIDPNDPNRNLINCISDIKKNWVRDDEKEFKQKLLKRPIDKKNLLNANKNYSNLNWLFE